MKRTILVTVLIIGWGAVWAQVKNELAAQGSPTQQQVTIDKAKNVWMLTYFRQRYPTRIEIDAKGNTVEVPLPDPMLINKLHIALSTDGRHWTPLNDNKPVWSSMSVIRTCDGVPMAFGACCQQVEEAGMTNRR